MSTKALKYQSSNDLPETVIRFDHVTKNFSLQSQKTFKEFIPALLKGEETKTGFTALKDISFEIKKRKEKGLQTLFHRQTSSLTRKRKPVGFSSASLLPQNPLFIFFAF